MGRHGLAPGSLALEITESVLMEEAHAPVTVLASLREYGLRLMLDDFGTGYSSLAYLKRFPLDVLKIDRSFVAGLGRDDEDSAIVAAIVQMARTLGLTVVAEGVERPEQLERLRELDCDRAQGRLIAEPMPAAEVGAADGRRAQRRELRIFDGHNDALSRIAGSGPGRARPGSSPATATATSTCRGRRAAGSPAAASPSSPCPPAGGRVRGRRVLRAGRRTAAAWREALAQVGAAAAAGARVRRPRIRVARTRRPTSTATAALAAVLHLEGAEPIGPGLDELELLHARGHALARARPGAARTRSRPACPFGFPGSPDQGPGLSGAGRALVAACGELRDPRRRLAPQRARVLGRRAS